ncbi:hypothetical protein CGLO_12149 [Colletotrichum gloeosporioides Cg-14]|uniref:AB hydrolase-1 domain-containing protein n=1 Tax=Colletotrichum gloeosporioides (strain Cg-14) TaxID=1237896 RepID=T0JZD6_COLGC|nr:hypothetical protein CGLO_12149 [Colletotrichum gloeosporioides Cg-14]
MGLTVLHCPPAADHKFDVVVVPGLGGHAFGSFKERNGDHMWPRDSLPDALAIGTSCISNARVMTYGYESTVQSSESVQHIGDIAESFHGSLNELARGRDPKPIIFIGHSMGGLVIKEALLLLSQSEDANDQKLSRAARGIAFFGVPHAGMNVESIRAMAGNNPNRSLIDSLSGENSYVLTQQSRRFNRLLDNTDSKINVVYFYETVMSPTAQQLRRLR